MMLLWETRRKLSLKLRQQLIDDLREAHMYNTWHEAWVTSFGNRDTLSQRPNTCILLFNR